MKVPVIITAAKYCSLLAEAAASRVILAVSTEILVWDQRTPLHTRPSHALALIQTPLSVLLRRFHLLTDVNTSISWSWDRKERRGRGRKAPA